MKHKIIGLCLTLTLLLSGCQLAKEAETGSKESQLIGFFVTKEPLEYASQIEAVLKTTEMSNGVIERYSFENVEGEAFYAPKMEDANGQTYIDSITDEGISEGHTGLTVNDDGEEAALEGTIYLTPLGNALYMNPVYQRSDGSVYMTSGNGIVSDEDFAEGVAWTHQMDEAMTINENGTEKKSTCSVSLSISLMYAPTKITVLQMDSNNQVICQTSYEPGKVPENLAIESLTEYLVIETEKINTAHELLKTRTVINHQETLMETFYCRDDGICVKKRTQLSWHE